MFISEDARAHLHMDNQHLHQQQHLHKKLKCQTLANAKFALDVQTSLYLGIPIGRHILAGMSTDIPLSVNVCS